MIKQKKRYADTSCKDHKGQVALKVALNILNKWNCSENEKQALLGISKSTLHKYRGNPFSARMTSDLLERISYILNIHAALRIVFDNDENVYGFVRMPNSNYFFNGVSPMDIMSKGQVAGLYETHRQIDSLRGGQW